MLQLYDINKIKVQGLTEYKDYKIESVLDSGDKTLSFSYPSSFSGNILEECYIRNETNEFVIKQTKDDGKWKSVVAVMNVEDLEGQSWEHFDLPNIGVKECLTLIVAGTGWKVEISDNIPKKRTIRKTNCSSWDLIQEVKKSYRVEIEFDTLNKTIKVYEKIGSNKGSYFIDTLNLKELELETDSYDYYTKIIAIGKNDIKVEVENYQYSKKVKTLIWKDEKYTDEDSLREDAILKLNEISKPRKSYRASIIDLARLSDKYKNILDYKLGDVVILISKDLKVKDNQKIVKITEYPDDPSKNYCEMSNTTLSFKELQKEFKDTSSTVNNITEDNGKISEKAIKEAVDKITIDKVDTKSLNAVSARIGELDVNKLNVNDAKIKFAEIDNALITKLETKDLRADNIKFNVASGDTLDLQALLSKFVTGENGQFLNITSSNITIADAVIEDAMIDNISAAKINTGVLNTNLVNIQGNNGNLLIKDNTIQIKDGNKTRVQIGKDASDDYNMYVWDATGKLMFDATGLKADGIKNQIIRNDMISDNANINGKKIDIDSLVTEVNKDSNTTLMKASKVALDTTGQSLEVSFNLLKTSSDDTKKKTEINTTEIGVINGQIDTLIKDTTIDEDGSTIKLKDSYSALKQTVSGLNSTVASHSTSITNLGASVTNAENTANIANFLADSKSKIFTSTPNPPYKVGDMWTGGPSGEIMKCKVSRISGSYTASDWEKASKYTDDTKANAVEGSLNTLSGKVTTVETKQATLEQSLEGFKTTVSSTYSKKTELNTLNDTVTSVEQKVKTVEQNITATAITNKVSESISGTGKVENSVMKFDKSGLEVNHSNASTKTKLNAEGLYILDDNGETIASLASKKSWTELKADKVFANNIENIYEGDANLYVDHNSNNIIRDGSITYPFTSFYQLKTYLEKAPIFNKNVTVNVVTSGTVNEQLGLGGLKGSGSLRINLNKNFVMRVYSTANYCMQFDYISIPIFINGGRTSYNTNDGAYLQGATNGITFYACKYAYVELICIDTQTYGIVFGQTNGRTEFIDLCSTPVGIRNNGANVFDHSSCGNCITNYSCTSAGVLMYGGSGEWYKPQGYVGEDGGKTFDLGNRYSRSSFRTKPPVPPTMDTYQSFNFSDYGYYSDLYGNWNSNGKSIYQGNWGYGNNRGVFTFNNISISSFLSGATILDGSTITLQRENAGGYSGPQTVYLYGTTHTSAGGSAPPATKYYTGLGTLAWGESKTFNLPKVFVQDLKSGVIKSVMLYTSDGSNYIKFSPVCTLRLKVNK